MTAIYLIVGADRFRPGRRSRDHDSRLSGNLYYNTLGNFSVHPYAALLFIDFLTGDLVHICGRVEILWSDPRVASYSGAQRAWRVYIKDG